MPFLKSIYKYSLLLLLFNGLLSLIAYLLLPVIKLNFSFGDIVFLSFFFSVVAFITLFIFFKGHSKEPDSQTLHILVAVSLKFLLEIAFALFWFIVAKKTSLESVLMFFVLYLCLTLFSMQVILKTLKNKAL
jgi:hypothetical protein